VEWRRFNKFIGLIFHSCVVFLACVHLALFLALSLISPGNSLVSSWFDLDATRQRKLLRDDTASALALPASDEGAALLQLPTWPVQALSRHVTCHVRPDWSAAQTTVVTSPWRVTRASREGGRISSQPTTADKHVERANSINQPHFRHISALCDFRYAAP